MQLTLSRTDLARAVGAVAKVVETRTTVPILSNVMLTAAGNGLSIMGTDLDILASYAIEASVEAGGAVCVNAKLLSDISKKAGDDKITMSLDGSRLAVKAGRSKFNLETLPAADFRDLSQRDEYNARFDLDIAAFFAPVTFAISTEETRYYLNGVFFRGGEQSVAVATDGHRLSRHIGASLPEFAGVIVPRKTVSVLPRGACNVSVSENRIRVEGQGLTIVSKLIDGTFPDYERVIPQSNDKIVTVERDEMMRATDRVATVSPERGRAVRLSVAPGSIGLSVSHAKASATDEIQAEYSGEPIEVGFNAAYVRDLMNALPAGPVKLLLNDGGSPALVKSPSIEALTLVIMPMRV